MPTSILGTSLLGTFQLGQYDAMPLTPIAGWVLSYTDLWPVDRSPIRTMKKLGEFNSGHIVQFKSEWYNKNGQLTTPTNPRLKIKIGAGATVTYDQEVVLSQGIVGIDVELIAVGNSERFFARWEADSPDVVSEDYGIIIASRI